MSMVLSKKLPKFGASLLRRLPQNDLSGQRFRGPSVGIVHLKSQLGLFLSRLSLNELHRRALVVQQTLDDPRSALDLRSATSRSACSNRYRAFALRFRSFRFTIMIMLTLTPSFAATCPHVSPSLTWSCRRRWKSVSVELDDFVCIMCY